MNAIPNFHDGYLTGVRLRDKSATIYVQRVDGVNYEIGLVGLEALQAEDFRQGNIISAVEVIVGCTPSEYIEFDRVFPPPHPDTAKKYHRAHALFVQRQRGRIERGEISLLVINPSYGADLLATCLEITCVESDPNGS